MCIRVPQIYVSPLVRLIGCWIHAWSDSQRDWRNFTSSWQQETKHRWLQWWDKYSLAISLPMHSCWHFILTHGHIELLSTFLRQVWFAKCQHDGQGSNYSPKRKKRKLKWPLQTSSPILNTLRFSYIEVIWHPEHIYHLKNICILELYHCRSKVVMEIHLKDAKWLLYFG